MKNLSVTCRALALGLFLFSCAGAFRPSRAEIRLPELSGEIGAEVQNDWSFSADDDLDQVNELYAEINAFLHLVWSERLSMETHVTFEGVQDQDPGEDTVFGNEGVYVEEIFMYWQDGTYGIKAGKFDPRFGVAWEKAPGIYGDELPEDYEITEMAGFEGHYTLDGGVSGEHTISAATFFADTSFLSESTVTKRGRLDVNDGGLANTENFSSYSATLNTANPAGQDGLGLHLGYRYLAAGKADAGREGEAGYGIGLSQSLDFSERVSADLLGEWVGLRNAEGTQDDLDYWTAAATVTVDTRWHVGISATFKDRSAAGGADIRDHLYNLAGGYDFDNGITVDLGYKHMREDGNDTRGVGVLVAYEYAF